MTSFADLGVPSALAELLARRGMTTPFPIQSLTLADAMAGRDLCGRAPTGSGKTLAFALPIAAKVGKAQPRRPRALILVPTRELAAQVAEELRPLAEVRNRSVATFYGGTGITRDERRLRSGVDIAVACPGRLADLVRRRFVDLGDVDLVVVDEADRMADMGFLPEVKRLLDTTAADRQTLLFSATLDGEVDVLVRRYQRDPVRHEVEVTGKSRADVRHVFWDTEATARVRVTGDVVRAAGSAIVFTRTKHAADRVARQLTREGVTAVAIHGNRSQGQRERALAAFTAGRAAVLVATDIAARGIHVDDVGVVVHFDPPATDKDYVHRSGRTGRAGATGHVVTFVTRERLGDVKILQRALRLPIGAEPIDLAQLGSDGATPRPRFAPSAPAPEQGRPAKQGRRGGPTDGRSKRHRAARKPSGQPAPSHRRKGSHHANRRSAA